MSLRSWPQIGSDVQTRVVPIHSPRAIVSHPSRDWHREVVDKLNELTALERGWDGYNAGPVSFDTANFALRMLETICREDAPCPQMVPGTSGDLQIEWHTDNGDVELHVTKPYRVIAWRANPGDGPEGEEIFLKNDFTAVATWILEVTEPALADAAAA